MSPQDLARECIRSLQTQGEASFIVVIGQFPQKGWPRGKCLGSDSRGRLYAYDAAKVLVRLMFSGVATFTLTDDNCLLFRVGEDEAIPLSPAPANKVAGAWIEYERQLKSRS